MRLLGACQGIYILATLDTLLQTTAWCSDNLFSARLSFIEVITMLDASLAQQVAHWHLECVGALLFVPSRSGGAGVWGCGCSGMWGLDRP